MKPIYALLLSTVFFFSQCSTGSQPSDPIPAHETIKIQSKQLGEERVINIWTADSYKNSSEPLPVMYMADGGTQEDFPHIANTLAKLIAEKKIKPLILVGIENTERRRDLSGPTEVAKDREIAPVVGGAAKFRAFIKEELFPEINQRYRTTEEKSIIGESLSGLFVMETFFTAPDMFDQYIAFDPSLWWNNQYLIRTADDHLSKFPDEPKRLWFAGSDASDISVHCKALAALLTKGQYPNLTWTFSDEPNEKHHTIFRATKEKAISWALGQ